MKSSEKKYFPMFVDLTDKKVVVAGAGTIAKRRIRAMLEFTEHLTVIAPEVNPELRTLEEQGKLIGYGGMWIILDEAHITNVCVLPEKRRQGYATKLMDELAGIASGLGADNMTLEVRVSNEEALKLYEKCGFHIQGVRKKYYSNNGEDAYIMWKEGTQ